jgi:hypothetical protein
MRRSPIHRRILSLVGVAAIAACVAAPSALAQGTITDDGASFVRGASAFDTSPEANFNGVGTGDQLFEFGWWVRIGAATQETVLPAPTTQTYSGDTSTITWTNLLGSGLNVVETATVTGLGASSGTVSAVLAMTNTTGAPVEVNVFHMVDADVGGSAAGDSAVKLPDGLIRTTDATNAAAMVDYEATGADAHQVLAFNASTDVAAGLSNLTVSDFANTGLPFGPGDVTAGRQWADRTIPAGTTRTFSVRVGSNDAMTTATTVTSSLNPSTVGGTTTLTATVAPSTSAGIVQFMDGATPVGAPVPVVGGVATLTTNALTVGDHSIIAAYSGASGVKASTSVALVQSLQASADASLTLPCDPTGVAGQTISCSATVANAGPGPAQDLQLAIPAVPGTTFAAVNAPGWTCATPAAGVTGAVTCDRAALAPAQAAAVALTLAVAPDRSPGPLEIASALTVGSVDPDSADRAATASIDVDATTTTTVASSASSVTAGQSVTLTATVADATAATPSGTVQFRDGATDLGAPVALSGTTAALSTAALAAGAHTITAVYSGNADFRPSASGPLAQTVAAAGTGQGPGPGGGPVQGAGVNFVGGQKRVTLSGTGGFGLRFGTTAGTRGTVRVTALVPGVRKKGAKRKPKAKTVALVANRSFVADAKGNVVLPVTLSKATRGKLPQRLRTFAATLTVSAGGRTFTHRFTLVRAKAKKAGGKPR